MEKKREKQYQVACVKLWEAVHRGGVGDNVGNHPNAFLSSSLDYWKEKNAKLNKGKPAESNQAGNEAESKMMVT